VRILAPTVAPHPFHALTRASRVVQPTTDKSTAALLFCAPFTKSIERLELLVSGQWPQTLDSWSMAIISRLVYLEPLQDCSPPLQDGIPLRSSRCCNIRSNSDDADNLCMMRNGNLLGSRQGNTSDAAMVLLQSIPDALRN
jgi:hypothetical protein